MGAPGKLHLFGIVQKLWNDRYTAIDTNEQDMYVYCTLPYYPQQIFPALTFLMQSSPAFQRFADWCSICRAHAPQVARLLGHVPLAHVVHGALEGAQGQSAAWKRNNVNEIIVGNVYCIKASRGNITRSLGLNNILPLVYRVKLNFCRSKYYINHE